MRLIVLTQHAFSPPVLRPFKSLGVELVVATTLAELEAALASDIKNTRLISFGSGVIVPASVLARLSGPAYNFHPGPPNYPGIFPSVFALYDGVSEFGVTLHEMVTQVDSGPIVAVETFAITKDCDRLMLDTASFAALLKLLEKFAPALADVTTSLPRLTQGWSGIRRSRKHFDEFCHLPENADEEEFLRRLRAAGEGPEHALTITRDGQTVYLTRQHGDGVVRGGVKV